MGGTRSPHRSLEKLPGWLPVGDTLRTALDKVINDNWDECSEVVDKLGSDHLGFTEALVEKARQAVEQALRILQRESITG